MKNVKLFVNNSRVDFDSFTFSGGEEHIKIKPSGPAADIQILAYIKTSSDLMSLLLLKDAVDREYGKYTRTKLVLPYVPYARQDRVCDTGEAFGLSVSARLINSMNFDKVIISDPHSDVTPALIENCEVRPQEILFAQSPIFANGFHDEGTIICAPDGGALKKAFKIASLYNKEIITAEKVRAMSTGKIIRTKVNCEDLTGKTVWMVDDIADGSFTFIKLAEELLRMGAKEVNLWVTHGIFSKGKQVVYDSGITTVYAKYDWTKDEIFK